MRFFVREVERGMLYSVSTVFIFTEFHSVTIFFNFFIKLTNEKRGGVGVISFGRSPFKLFSLKFSNKSVQAPSCERPKTTQRTLFLLFANNICFPIALLCRAAAHFSNCKLN
jgi:hypothetical protein